MGKLKDRTLKIWLQMQRMGSIPVSFCYISLFVTLVVR